MNNLPAFEKKLLSLGFSRRERQVCERIMSGADRKTMAACLFISIHTLDIHLARIRRKLSARTTARCALLLWEIRFSTLPKNSDISGLFKK
jgi:DNA-binding CsgD family transcriptional regulator